MSLKSISAVLAAVCLATLVPGARPSPCLGVPLQGPAPAVREFHGQLMPAQLLRWRQTNLNRLTVRQLDDLAKKTIIRGRAYRRQWFAAGHKYDYISPLYFQLAGRCYRQAVVLSGANGARASLYPSESKRRPWRVTPGGASAANSPPTGRTWHRCCGKRLTLPLRTAFTGLCWLM
jgi:hypothetical protein